MPEPLFHDILLPEIILLFDEEYREIPSFLFHDTLLRVIWLFDELVRLVPLSLFHDTLLPIILLFDEE